ncbi:hypothetical protein KFK14_11570 [Sphingobium phenoxybenzoativorans]|uniref:Uncharacterized protein n=1 Tax=Sphingobium phenoxybenzoativorans TaxID=1592790 RepID=A0A975KAS5_9SPHN|nr:hypothetical protein [Sphingobium phenoxybenzoativorans]QUT07966.1 hypothetical protein KFK14_11570 [Sphingobium phenoxybenzoativorans]
MIERVARAIAGAEYGDGFDRPWEPFLPHARAAVEAMREPTDNMVEAGCFVDDLRSDRPGGSKAYDEHWMNCSYRAMIDAILTEEG